MTDAAKQAEQIVTDIHPESRCVEATAGGYFIQVPNAKTPGEVVAVGRTRDEAWIAGLEAMKEMYNDRTAPC